MSHRSKKRIRNLGEVFTPDPYISDMLTLLSKDNENLWKDEENSFFEPCCGHGNIVIQIYEKRISAIYENAISKKIQSPAYYAVANTINTLWAIDIDPTNINICRQRVLQTTLEFLSRELNIGYLDILRVKQKFIAHLLCAINWHIYENEALSALSNEAIAKVNAEKTKVGKKWFSKNGHLPIDFNLSWAVHFKQCEMKNSIPIDYERSLCFIKNVLQNKLNGYKDFEFAKQVLTQKIT